MEASGRVRTRGERIESSRRRIESSSNRRGAIGREGIDPNDRWATRLQHRLGDVPEVRLQNHVQLRQELDHHERLRLALRRRHVRDLPARDVKEVLRAVDDAHVADDVALRAEPVPLQDLVARAERDRGAPVLARAQRGGLVVHDEQAADPHGERARWRERETVDAIRFARSPRLPDSTERRSSSSEIRGRRARCEGARAAGSRNGRRRRRCASREACGGFSTRARARRDAGRGRGIGPHIILTPFFDRTQRDVTGIRLAFDDTLLAAAARLTHGEVHPVRGRDRDRLRVLLPLSLRRRERVPPHERAEHDARLQQREILPQAIPRPLDEWQKLEVPHLVVLVRLHEPRGVVLQRLRPKIRAVVHALQ
eukprot:31351-Pelagococcus_subviridis.AAC.2